MKDFDRKWYERYEDCANRYVPDHSYSYLTKKEFDRQINFFKKIFERSNVSKYSKILDVGCGVGVYTNLLSDLGYKDIHGVDFSPSFIDIAKKRNNSISYSVGNVYSLGFEDSSFDVVMCLGLFQSISDEVKAFNELKRVLKPDGKLFIMTLKKFNFIEKLSICLFYLPYLYLRGSDIHHVKRIYNNLFSRKMDEGGAVCKRYDPSIFLSDSKYTIRYLGILNISYFSSNFIIYPKCSLDN